VAASTVVAILGRNELLEMLGRDSGLTGRMALYNVWCEYVTQHLLIGYGYGEVFSEGPYSLVDDVNREIRYGHVDNFESGYMQAAIDFGLCGVFLYLYMMGDAARRAVRYAKESMSPYRLAPLAVMLYIIVSSLNEVYITLFNTVHVGLLSYLFTRLPRETDNTDAPTARRRVSAVLAEGH
jgi:exopolysaccharide production protein ExoQ